MGANAVTTVPVYVAGEVLTAADLNITNSGIPVFASTVERDAAFGGTGEKTLAEGQFAYLETGNVTQYYDGAAWQPVGVSPGLVLIKTYAPSSVASLSFDAATFSATYKNYLVTIDVTTSSSTELGSRFRVGGVDASGSNYIRQFLYATSTTVSGGTGTVDSQQLTLVSVAGRQIVNLWLYQPFVAAETTSLCNYSNSAPAIGQIGGRHTLSTSYDSMTIFPYSGNMSGNINVYGVAS
jgi:hypothetical protein